MIDHSYVHLPPYRVDLAHAPMSTQDGVDWGLSAYGIPEAWKKTCGEGITVAVIDSGIAQHKDLPNVVDFRNFSSDSETFDSLGHGCISPDDEVYTSACGVQKISTLFDRVDGVVHLLADGSVIKDVSRLGIFTLGYDVDSQATVRRRVLAVHKLPYKGNVLSVRTGESEMRFTPWHPVYVQTSQRGADRTVVKLRADELAVGNRIVASRENDGVYSEIHQIPLAPRWECRFCGHEAKAGNRKQCKGCHKSRWHEGPVVRSLPLDEDLAFFLGLVASDGHVMKGSKTVCFINNRRELADIFDSLCLKLFGKLPKETAGDSRSPAVIEQRLHSVDAWNLCSKQIGMPSDKSRTLEFPELIAKSNPDVVFAFLAGVIEGDGSVCKRTGRIRIASGSERFARRIVSVCRFLGVYASLVKVPPSKTGFKTSEHSWCVRVGHCSRLISKLRHKIPAVKCNQWDRRAIGIREITPVPYDGPMYDLTVEGSHNYAANGLIVSNTHVAGVIGASSGPCTGIAHCCTLLSYKVLGHSGMGSNTAVAEAVRHAADAGVNLVCMSLGSPAPSDRVHQAIQYANQKGVIIICAAGNDGGSVNFPAAFPETIAVGAVDRHGNVCEFSSRGREIVVAAPGQDITSTWLADGYATISGTSMAAPFVTGVLALYLAHHGPATKTEITDALSKTCRDAGPAGHDPEYGWGLLDPHKLLAPKAMATEAGVTIFIPGARIL